MKSSVSKLFFSMLAGLFMYTAVFADGMFIPMTPREFEQSKRNTERLLISEPQQKAAIYYSKGIETLIISPSFKGSASNFAWVIPVPAQPKVSIVDGALFHELKTFTSPPTKFRRPGPVVTGGVPGAAPSVEVLERKTLGVYDVSVLRSNDANALTKWLKQNGYQIPEPDKFVRERINPIPYYIRKHWTFIACRVKIPEKAQRLQTGSLAPIKLVFKSKQIIYPMKLSSLSMVDFSLLVYLLLPTDEFRINDYQFNPIDSPKEANFAVQCGILRRNQTLYPTIAKVSNREIHVFRLTSHINPYECNKDIVWAVK